MGNMGWLGRHYACLWIANPSRCGFDNCDYLSVPCRPWYWHGHGTYKPQCWHPGYFQAGRRGDGRKYVRLSPKSRNAARCCRKFSRQLTPLHDADSSKLAGTIFSNSMSDKLSELGLPTSIAHDSEQYIFVLRTMADSPQKSAILSSYMKGFDSVFIMTTAVSASALVVSLIIRKYSMDKILLAQFSAR